MPYTRIVKSAALAALLAAGLVGDVVPVFAQDIPNAIVPPNTITTPPPPQPRVILQQDGTTSSVVVLPPTTVTFPDAAAPAPDVTADPGIADGGLHSLPLPGRGFDVDIAPFRS